jgi:hypothetical protein
MTTTRLRLLGLLSVGFFAVHAAGYFLRGEPYEVLWCCTVANLGIGVALLTGSPRLNAIGLCWLVYGNGLWLADVVVSRHLIPTSILIHIGGPLISFFALRRLGWPRRTYVAATLALMGLQLFSRVTTPPQKNINVAFGLPAGFEWMFPNYPAYYAVMLAIALAVFFATERACLAYLAKR